jgi:hypothetical protein
MRIVSLLLCAVASIALAGGAARAADAPGDASAPAEAVAPAAQEGMPASGGAESAAAPAGDAATPDAAPASQAPAAGEASAASEAASPAPKRAAVKRKPRLGPVGHDASGQRGRIHTVASGDTLWDISDAYLGTPWVWPSLWQDNPNVPNPHRIFPGNKLWITPTTMRRVTDAEAAELLAGELPASADDAMPAPPGGLSVPNIDAIGFVSADMIAASGSILGSSRDDVWYSAEMPVYLSLGAGQVQKGDRFTVVRAEQKVRDPETNRSLGVYVDRLGWVEVVAVHAESAEAVIRESVREMTAGDRLLPHSETPPEVMVRSGAPPVEGQIAFLPDLRTVQGGQDVVFLNRGSEHGLAVGSPLEVYRPGARVRDRETRERRMLPDDVLANLVVVSAEPQTAVAVVTHATEEIGRGDMFRGASALER